jgi:hypothetical protein
MVALTGITITGGVNFTGGVSISTGTNFGTGTVTFSEYYQPGDPQGQMLQDQSGSITASGFVINNGQNRNSGVAIHHLTSANINWFTNAVDNNGYVWTVNWAAGSTYASTPVAMYWNQFGLNAAVFYILDPSDGTYGTSISSGTFNFPATFVPGVTPA